MITLPESVRFFYADRANHAALNTLADATFLPPYDMPWSELRTFVAAKASAEQLKADLLLFGLDVWAATWGAALAELDIATESPPLGEYEPNLTPSLGNVWKDRGLNNWTVLCDGRWLLSSLWIDGEMPGVLKLSFFVREADESSSESDVIDLGPNWTDEQDSFRNTVSGVPLSGHSAVNLDGLKELAKAALRRVFAG